MSRLIDSINEKKRLDRKDRVAIQNMIFVLRNIRDEYKYYFDIDSDEFIEKIDKEISILLKRIKVEKDIKFKISIDKEKFDIFPMELYDNNTEILREYIYELFKVEY